MVPQEEKWHEWIWFFKLGATLEGLQALSRTLQRPSVAFPARIGCGLAGGRWPEWLAGRSIYRNHQSFSNKIWGALEIWNFRRSPKFSVRVRYGFRARFKNENRGFGSNPMFLVSRTLGAPDSWDKRRPKNLLSCFLPTEETIANTRFIDICNAFHKAHHMILFWIFDMIFLDPFRYTESYWITC